MFKKIIAVLGSLLGVFIATFLWKMYFSYFILILIRIIFIVVFAIAFGVTIAFLVYKNSIQKLEDYNSYENALSILKKSKQKFWITLGGIILIPVLFSTLFLLQNSFSFSVVLNKYKYILKLFCN